MIAVFSPYSLNSFVQPHPFNPFPLSVNAGLLGAPRSAGPTVLRAPQSEVAAACPEQRPSDWWADLSTGGLEAWLGWMDHGTNQGSISGAELPLTVARGQFV